MVMHIYESFGLKHLKLVINSIGDSESRKEYNEALVKHFEPVIDTFCSDCQSRLHTNPMRILDCKIDRDKEAVKMHLVSQIISIMILNLIMNKLNYILII